MVVETLDMFDGQLSLTDIYHSTQKELYYLREHKRKMIEKTQGAKDKAFAKAFNGK